jgi:hypothetical protein
MTLGLDSSGNLYANDGRAISVYAPTKQPGDIKFVRSIRQGIHSPDAFAFGPSDELFVANWPRCNPPCGRASVTVYESGASTPSRRITDGVTAPYRLAVDTTGRLYVANSPFRPLKDHGFISVYAPGGTQPVRLITKGIDNPLSLALDPVGNLYVANERRSITVYNPGGDRLLRTIPKDTAHAQTLLFGSP